MGSFTGRWIGGRLTDSIGFYNVITGSLFFGGIGFFMLQYIDSFFGCCAGIISLILIADAYRPAIFVTSDVYSKEGNKTRSIALIRLAINLGYSIGPVIGGIIIAKISYTSLFWMDGITSATAAILLFILLKLKKATKEGLRFLVINLTDWTGVLVIGMLLMTLGEMVSAPFSNAHALEMAPKARKANCIALFSMSFFISHMIGHTGGMNLG